MNLLILLTTLLRGWAMLGLIVGLIGGVAFAAILIRGIRPRAVRRPPSRSCRSHTPEPPRDAWSESARRLDPRGDEQDSL